ncbi:hypothetical protein OR1_01546 [Geobacter sp. OR-1]|uniref:sulfotransferase n=1 Tax=Geobacter sp. OR-1 TaxID=1266765 RepID=UPI000542B4AA|nr:sulfotransferase [Geobacter sp. OR-1]GAM09271.1 hypothetical protein OR1_01546 [Geobacter sp. OR-1]
MQDIKRKIHSIRSFRKGILEKRRNSELFLHSLKDVRRVVIINSSSRSGSSLLYALLGKLPHVISLTGEAAPFYKLNTVLDKFNPHLSDRLPTEMLDAVIDQQGLSLDFMSDLYLAGMETDVRKIDADTYIDDLMLRFSLQWTDLELDHDILRKCIAQAFEQYAATALVFRTEDFYLELLAGLCSIWPQINPFYYDIGTDKVALRFPFIDIPVGPPASVFTIEEPPFILLPPCRRPAPADLADKVLLLKSTVDCYRMNLVEKLFPQADISIIHLVRNPAATINGIFDGWHHRGFFSHNLATRFDNHSDQMKLRIKGYSDLYPFGSTWWNFDLPAGWESFADRELVEVCAFQWHSANAEILGNLAAGGKRSCTVHFEDIIRSIGSRRDVFSRMLDFMTVPEEQAELLRLDDLPVVQSTLPPQLYRWKKRRDIISRLLDNPKVVAMAETLGYYRESMDDWL